MTGAIHVPYADYEIESVRTVLVTIHRTAGANENAAENLREHWRGLPAHLSGSPVATTGYYSAMVVRTRDADDLAQMLRSVWKALDNYADDAEMPLTNLARLREEAAEWQSRRPVDVIAAPDTPMHEVWAVKAEWAVWNADKARIEKDVAYWSREYERIADVCAAALKRAKDPSSMSWWEQLQAAIRSYSREDFGITSEHLMVSQAVTLADTLIAGELDEAGMARLELLLTELESNPEASTAFLNALGGAGTLKVLTELGRGLDSGVADPRTHRMAQAFRGFVSVASDDWSDADAQDFVQDMLPAPSDDTLQLIGYLFNDTKDARMSATFTVAVANRLDEWERTNLMMGSPQGYLVGSLTSSGLSVLTTEENTPPGGLTDHVNTDANFTGRDPAVSVFETLALYPEHALDWLVGGEPAEPHGYDSREFSDTRASYWIGQRLWSVDGSAAAMGLLESAMHTPNGIASGTYDREVWTSQADLVSSVVDALGREDNTHFGPDTLSPDAQRSLASSLTTALPWLIESSIVGSPDREDGVKVQFMAAGDPLVPPVLDDSSLTRVWGTIANTPDGFAVLTDGVADYQRQAVVMAELGDYTGVQWDDALQRVVQLEAFHQGSAGGVEQYLARLADERFATKVELAGTMLGASRVPGAEKLPQALLDALNSEMGQAAIGAAIGGAEELAVTRWGDSLSVEISETNDELLTGYIAQKKWLTETLGDHPPGLIEQLGQTSVDTKISDLMGTFKAKYKAALVDINQEGIWEEFENKVDAHEHEKGSQ